MKASSDDGLDLEEEEVKAYIKPSVNSNIYKDLDELYYKAIIKP